MEMIFSLSDHWASMEMESEIMSGSLILIKTTNRLPIFEYAYVRARVEG